MTLNVWTVLWVSPDGKPYHYRTAPADYERADQDESRFYTPEDVIKYKRMVKRFLPEAKFRCLSNVIVPGVETVPLKSGMVGWWPKMELFRPDLPTGRNLYFDLDTLIVNGLRAIIKFPAPFAAIKPGKKIGSNQSAPWKDQEGFWRVPRYQTSVMVWDSEYGHKFWHAFTPEHKARLASDQDFLGEVFPNEARMPSEWFRKIGGGSPPSPETLVVLTIKRRNDDLAKTYKWVEKLWR